MCAGEEGAGLDVSEGTAPHPTGGGHTPAVAGEGVVDALVLTQLSRVTVFGVTRVTRLSQQSRVSVYSKVLTLGICKCIASQVTRFS